MRFQHKLPRLNRRDFLIGAAVAGGGLAIGFRSANVAAEDLPETDAITPFDAYLRIDADGGVTVLSAHMEGGQGVYNGLATLVAEELDADWSRLTVESVAGATPLYGNLAFGGAAQFTGGSTAMASSWDRYRQAGATARALLVAAAAQRWGVQAGDIRVANGVLSHSSGQRAGFGELASAAAKLPVPAAAELKTPAEWELIGNPEKRRVDTAPKTTGEQDYTIDVRLPGMLTAVLARPPRFGATVKSFEAASAKQVTGVVNVVATPRGIAVLARDYWAAVKGRDALKVVWDETGAEKRSSADLLAEYKALATDSVAATARAEGDAAAALASADRVIEGDFTFPYLAHGAMEPLNAVARFRDGILEIWAGHQLPDLYQYVASQVMGIAPDKVKLHVMVTGGFFGRRATPDADVIVEVASIVKALGDSTPVKVQWTREDDTQGGRYRPMYYHRVRAALDKAGKPIAWRHRVVGQSIIKGTPFEGMITNGVDGSSVEGASDMPYAIPNQLVDVVDTEVGVPVLWWRSVGHTHTAYVVETMIDDLAKAAASDPVEFRRELLAKHPRHLGVLNLAAEKAGWTRRLPKGRSRGVALHKSFDTYVAQVVEISINAGRLQVERVVCAVDCGVAINPDVVKAQLEGSIGFGLGAFLHSEITLDNGMVQQKNFDGYQVLRIDEMPLVEVHIMPSSERPTGVGEPATPVIAPAVSNAIFAATGKRIRRLPLGDQLLG